MLDGKPSEIVEGFKNLGPSQDYDNYNGKDSNR